MDKTRYLTSQKNEPSMAETIAMKLLVALGLPMFIMGWIADLDSLKSWCAFVGGGVMLAIRFAFLVDKLYHASWVRKMERRRIKRLLQADQTRN